MRKLIFALAGLAVVAATPAWADSCIRHDDLYNWSSIDDKTLILENFRHEKWVAKLIGTCSNFKFHERIEIRSPGALAISCIEKGDSVITRDNGIRGRCAIMSIERYVPPPKQTSGDGAMAPTKP
ncbi:MAG TPA: DUF6491 family protein [Rhizomicrobium sp.]|nr:DUF6491 family protein [Rhizomicrobium sp.]